MRFEWNPDPVERVFGIVIAGALILGIALFFGPCEILGKTRDNLIMLLFFGAFGTTLGLLVVGWFRNR